MRQRASSGSKNMRNSRSERTRSHGGSGGSRGSRTGQRIATKHNNPKENVVHLTKPNNTAAVKELPTDSLLALTDENDSISNINKDKPNGNQLLWSNDENQKAGPKKDEKNLVQ